jgi:hypothetical protein
LGPLTSLLPKLTERQQTASHLVVAAAAPMPTRHHNGIADEVLDT